uniref:Uncharacterized protein n=1 Tax=Arthrobacter sp. JBH1 TaxID=723551 RepID=I1Y9H9_9MICC|nr:hypothetical protein [Arthrobacter sp. JBH1]
MAVSMTDHWQPARQIDSWSEAGRQDRAIGETPTRASPRCANQGLPRWAP